MINDFDSFIDVLTQRKNAPRMLLERAEGWAKVKSIESNYNVLYRELPDIYNALQKEYPECLVYSETIESGVGGSPTHTYNCLCQINENRYVNLYVYIDLEDTANSDLTIQTEYLDEENHYLKSGIDRCDQDLVERLGKLLRNEILKRPEFRLLHVTGIIE